MKDLIAKLEAATEGSRELDREIAVHPETPSCGVVKNADLEQVRSAEEDWVPPMVSVPHYTTSIDAALTLVPEGHVVYQTWFSNHPSTSQACWACCAPPGLGGQQSARKRRHLEANAHTPALALSIAALKARSG